MPLRDSQEETRRFVLNARRAMHSVIHSVSRNGSRVRRHTWPHRIADR